MMKKKFPMIQFSNYSIDKLRYCCIVILNHCIIVALLIFIIPAAVFAQTQPQGQAQQAGGNSATSTDLFSLLRGTNFFQMDFGTFLSRIITAVIVVGALAVLLFLVWGGIDWLVSEGDKEKMSSAKGKITNAVIGLVILIAVWAIWNLILQFFGLNAALNTGS